MGAQKDPQNSSGRNPGESQSAEQHQLSNQRIPQDHLMSILQSVPHALLVLTSDLRVQMANDAFCEMFQLDLTKSINQPLYELKEGLWDILELRTLLESVLSTNSPHGDYEIEHFFECIGKRTVLFNARWLAEHSVILLTMTDVTRYRKAENALRESERRYRTLFESIDEAFCIAEVLFKSDGHAVDYRILETNPAFAKQTGISSAAGRCVSEIVPHHEAHWDEILGRIALTGESKRFVSWIEHPDKQWYDVFAFRVGQPNENKVAILLNNITERKESEEALQQAQESLELALDAACMGTWHLELDTRQFHRSSRYNQIFGYSEPPPQWDKETYRKHVLPEDRHIVDASIQQAIASGEFSMDVRVRRLDGNVRWIHDQGRVYYNNAGKPTRMAGVTQDITVRKKAEEALRQSEERYSALFNSIDEAFALCEIILNERGKPVDYRMLDVNPAFERMTGFAPEVAKGKTARELVPELEDWWIETYGKVALEGEIMRFENYVAGLERWYDAYAFPQGHGCFALVFTDITERRRAEEGVLKMNESLEEQIEERTRQVRQLVSELTLSEQTERQRVSQIIHDEVQQDLYGLQFQLTFLRDALGDSPKHEDREEALSLITELEEGLLEAIQKARDLSVRLSPPMLERDGLLEIMSWLVSQMKRQHGLAVQIETDTKLPLPQAELRLMIFQLVRELLFNIVKHAGASQAWVRLNHADDHFHIEVIDRGAGFDVDAVLHERGRSHGLWQNMQRLELIGGHMQIDSNPGSGTRVLIICPVNADRERSPEGE